MGHYQPPPTQPPPDRQRRRNSPPRESDYGGATPGRAYTVPIQGRRPALPPPRHAGERIWRAIQRYLGLQRGAQTSSRTWWGLKIIQGFLLGLPLILLGALLMLARPVLGGVECITGLGPLFLLLGILALTWNALAPWTSTWHVTIPAGEYWVVQDRHGTTLQYLSGGSHRLNWQMNVWLRPYVDFTRVPAVTWVQNVMPAAEEPVDLEITTELSFQPHNAPPGNYVELRKIDRRETFERMIQRRVHNAVRTAFQRRHYDTDAQLDLLYHQDAIAEIAQRSLRALGVWGLFPYAEQLPDVNIYGLPPTPGGYAYDTAQRTGQHATPPHGTPPPPEVPPPSTSRSTPADAPPATVSGGVDRTESPGAEKGSGSGEPSETRYGEQRSTEEQARRQRRRQRADPRLQPDHTSEDPMDRRSDAKAKRRQSRDRGDDVSTDANDNHTGDADS